MKLDGEDLGAADDESVKKLWNLESDGVTGTTYEEIGTRSVEHDEVEFFTIVATEVPQTVEVVYLVLVLFRVLVVHGVVLGYTQVVDGGIVNVLHSVVLMMDFDGVAEHLWQS